MQKQSNQIFYGHTKQEETLKRSFIHNQLAHSILFCGPRGIGKATLAYRLANFIFSSGQAKEYLSPHNHPDLLVVSKHEGEKEIGVSEIRKLGQFMRLTPTASLYKIVIIDSCDHLNANSANALLKILEEPPARSYLFLISHKPAKLLPTITSRCRKVILTPLNQEDSLKILRQLEPKLDQQVAEKALLLGYGLPAIAYDIYQENGIEYYTTLLDHLINAPDLDRNQILKFSDNISGKNSDKIWLLFTHLLSYFLHKALKVLANIEVEYISSQEETLIQNLYPKYSIANWLKLCDKVHNLIQKTDFSHLDRKQTSLLIFEQIIANAKV
jgi:DNA polymerase-3 subunit delta'